MTSPGHTQGSSDVVVPTRVGSLSGLIDRPNNVKAAFCFAHGAGAGMRHSFLERIASLLAAREVATLRFQFPYMEHGKRRPDPPSIATVAVADAIRSCAARFPGVPLVAGGKSFGGRMTTLAAAELGLEEVSGIVLLGFPLHQPKMPSQTRAEHLSRVRQPLLFIQGTRDALAEIALIREVTAGLPNATLEEIDRADHSFAVPKSVAPSAEPILARITDRMRSWIDGVVVRDAGSTAER